MIAFEIAKRRSAYFKGGEGIFQIVYRRYEEIDKLFVGALPARIVSERAAVRFVPHFPVFYVHFKAVCPALVVVEYYMFADFCPFKVIFGREGAFFFIVLDACAQTVENLRSALAKTAHINVGHFEVVGRGVFLVCVEITEYAVYVHAPFSAVMLAKARVVQSCKRNVCSFKQVEITVAAYAHRRRPVVYCVHWLYFAGHFVKIDFYTHCFSP